MQHTRPADLVSEAQRYLDVVELFRAEGCQPHWRLEAAGQSRRRAASRSGKRNPLDPVPGRMK
jgi:hypothetical protein